MTSFGQLFASRESLAIMLRMAKSPKPAAKSSHFRTFSLGEHQVVVDLRLLTTTTSQGI